MSDRARKSAPPGPPAQEESVGSLPTDPALEAALREAADAVPDPGRGSGGEPDEAELVLERPLDTAPEAEVNRLHREVADSNDRVLRLQADFENFRKRALRERQEALQYGPQNLVKDLLSVVDNLDRAIDHAQESAAGDLQTLLQGVELVRREFLGVLANHQVIEIEALGKLFNPAVHEAMAQIPDGSVEPNTVVDILQKGYQLHDRLVRPARVVVAKPADDPGDGGGEAAG